MAHKRSAARLDSREIERTRRARAEALKEGTGSAWPDGMPRPGDYESVSHYHYRMNHKNLSRPILTNGPVHVVVPYGTTKAD
jgi:hypothetical protein